jgi:hypothetical protein
LAGAGSPQASSALIQYVVRKGSSRLGVGAFPMQWLTPIKSPNFSLVDKRKDSPIS